MKKKGARAVYVGQEPFRPGQRFCPHAEECDRILAEQLGGALLVFPAHQGYPTDELDDLCRGGLPPQGV